MNTLILFSLVLAAENYQHVPAVECKEFRDCMEALPKGKFVATTVFLADMADYAAMNKIYEGYFPTLKPARNTVAVRLPRGIRMAMNAVLYEGDAELKGLTPHGVTNVVPITPGILTPDRLFIAGILGRDSNSGTVPSAPQEQIDMCLARLTKVLATAQLGPKDLVQATVYHSAVVPRELVEASIARFLGPQPTIAITILEVPALALGANVALNGVARRN